MKLRNIINSRVNNIKHYFTIKHYTSFNANTIINKDQGTGSKKKKTKE